jgi:hypothetical protein
MAYACLTNPKMFVGIKLTINISVKLEKRGTLGIFFVQSNVPIDQITWKLNDIKPFLVHKRNNGKELDLYFKWSEIIGFKLLTGLVQKEYVGNNLADYVKSIDTAFGAEHSESGLQEGLALGAISLILAVGGFILR